MAKDTSEQLHRIIQNSDLSPIDKANLISYLQKLPPEDQEMVYDIVKDDSLSLEWFNNNLKKRLELYKNKDVSGYKKFIEEEKNFLKSL